MGRTASNCGAVVRCFHRSDEFVALQRDREIGFAVAPHHRSHAAQPDLARIGGGGQSDEVFHRFANVDGLSGAYQRTRRTQIQRLAVERRKRASGAYDLHREPQFESLIFALFNHCLIRL